MKKFFENVRKLSTPSSSQSSSHLRRLSLSSVSSMPQIKVLRGGYNIDLQKVDASFTKLHKAVYLNNEDRVKKYLSQFGVNSVDNHNRTPLHFAAVNGNVRIIKMLIMSGANVNIQDADGRTPLIKAIECECNDEVVRIMLDYGAKLDLADYDKGNTALHHCLLNANLDCALYIIRNALIIDYNKRNHKKETFLHLAAKILDLYPVIEELIANGIEIEAKDELGRTAANVAKLHNNHDAEKLIRKYVNAQQHQQQRSLNNDDDILNDDQQVNDGGGDAHRTIANGNMFDDGHNPDGLDCDDDLSPIIYDNIDQNVLKQNRQSSRLNKNKNKNKNQNDSPYAHNKNAYKMNTIDGSLDFNFRNNYRFSGFFEDVIIEEKNSNDDKFNNDNQGGGPITDVVDNSSLTDNDEPLYSNYDQSSASNSANSRKQTETPDNRIISQNKSERSESIMDFISDNMSDLDEMLNKDLNNAIEVRSSIEFDNNNIMIDIDSKNEAYYSNNSPFDQNMTPTTDDPPSTELKTKQNDSQKGGSSSVFKKSSNNQKSKPNSFLLQQVAYNDDGGSQSNSLIEQNHDSAKEQAPIKYNNNADSTNKNIEQQLKEESSEPITITNNSDNDNQTGPSKPAKSYAEVLASPKKIGAVQPMAGKISLKTNYKNANSNDNNNNNNNNNNLIEEKNLRMKKNGKFSKKSPSQRNNNNNGGNSNNFGKNSNKSKMMAAMMVRNTTTTTSMNRDHENPNPNQNHQPMIMNINNVGHRYSINNVSNSNDTKNAGGQHQNVNDDINGINRVDNDENLINYATKDDMNNIFLSANQSKSISSTANRKSIAHDQGFSMVSSPSLPSTPSSSSSSSTSASKSSATPAAFQIPHDSSPSSSSSTSSSKRTKCLKTKKIGLNATAAAAFAAVAAAAAAAAPSSATNHLQANDDGDGNHTSNNERAQNKNIQSATAAAAAAASIQRNIDHNHNNNNNNNNGNNTKYINLVNSLKHLLSERMFMMGVDPKQNNHNNNDDTILFNCISKMFYEIKQYQTSMDAKNKEIDSLKITMDCLQKQLEQEKSYVKDLESRLTNTNKTQAKFDGGIGLVGEPNNNNNKSSSSKMVVVENDAKILIELLKEQHQLKLKHYETILNEQLDENFALKKQCHYLKELIQIYEMSNKNQQEEQQQQQQQQQQKQHQQQQQSPPPPPQPESDGSEGPNLISYTAKHLTFLIEKFDEKMATFNEINQKRLRNIDDELRLRKDCMQQFQDEIDTLKFFTSQWIHKTGVETKSSENNSNIGNDVKQSRRHSEQIKDIDHDDGGQKKQQQQQQQPQQQQGSPPPPPLQALRSTPSMKLSSKMKSFSMQDLASLDADYSNGKSKHDELLLAEQSPLFNNHRGYHTTDGRTTSGHQTNANIDYSNSFSYKSKYFQSKINELRKQLGYVN